jgi:hypothetical protein
LFASVLSLAPIYIKSPPNAPLTWGSRELGMGKGLIGFFEGRRDSVPILNIPPIITIARTPPPFTR